MGSLFSTTLAEQPDGMTNSHIPGFTEQVFITVRTYYAYSALETLSFGYESGGGSASPPLSSLSMIHVDKSEAKLLRYGR